MYQSASGMPSGQIIWSMTITDLYMARTASDAADVVKITASEVYAFGYGTNNSPNIGGTGIVEGGKVATLQITGAYTVNDPLRIYGASRRCV